MAQRIAAEYREKMQIVLQKKILKCIADGGLAAAEYQIQYLVNHPKTVLPTVLNYKETLRMYQLTVSDYKKKLEKKQNQFKTCNNEIH
jgi:hypothetical protein